MAEIIRNGIAQVNLEPQEDAPVAHCIACDDDLYEGQLVYLFEGDSEQPVCENCIEEYLIDRTGTVKEFLEAPCREEEYDPDSVL